MLRKSLLSLWIAVFLAPAFAQQGNAPSFDGKSWWEHIKVLAADNMEGRDTGSPGLKKAEAYVVGQLKSAGLQPAGVKGYYQPVKFVSRHWWTGIERRSGSRWQSGAADPGRRCDLQYARGPGS